ncbi:MAG: RNA 2',3'-cyclic phosphodiesterase [Candidatus Aminicenantales bacterium]
MRSFIAVDLPDDVKARISAFVQKIKRTAPGGIRWAKIDDLHVTLKFLGEIEETAVEAIGAAVGKIAAETPVFPLTVMGTGTFPPGSPRPRLLWIGLDDSGPLRTLQGRFEEALETLGFPREDRPFRPHLTAARVRAAGLPQRIIDPFEENRAVLFGNFEVRNVILYQSLLRPEGAEHRPLLSGALRP